MYILCRINILTSNTDTIVSEVRRSDSRAVIHEVVVVDAGAREAQLAVGVRVVHEQAAAERLPRALRLLAPPLQPVVLVAHELRLLALLLRCDHTTENYRLSLFDRLNVRSDKSIIIYYF